MSDGRTNLYKNMFSNKLIQNKLKVYIASPYTNGWMPDNVRLSMQAMDELLTLNYIPFCPLLNHFQSIMFERPENNWLDYDLEWLKVCNIMVRIHSKHNNEYISSPGADKEEQLATELNIPILHVQNIDELITHFSNNQYINSLLK